MNHNIAPLYIHLARANEACKRCLASGNTEWLARWQSHIDELIQLLPSGSGFDAGTKFDSAASTAQRLVFYTQFHHMDADGFYDGWTSHTVTLKPDLELDYRLHVSGRDRNDIKAYIADTFRECLDLPLRLTKDGYATVNATLEVPNATLEATSSKEHAS